MNVIQILWKKTLYGVHQAKEKNSITAEFQYLYIISGMFSSSFFLLILQ